jgi:hypothetical protein
MVPNTVEPHYNDTDCGLEENGFYSGMKERCTLDNCRGKKNKNKNLFTTILIFFKIMK